MKILHIAETARGGVGTYLNELYQAGLWRESGTSHRFLVPDEHRSQLLAVPSEDVRVFGRPKRSLASLANLWTAVQAEIESHRPDVVHLHSTFAGVFLRAGAVLSLGRTAVIYSPHGWFFQGVRSPLVRWGVGQIEAVFQHWACRVVVVSRFEYNLGLAIGISKNKLRLIYNGLTDSYRERSAATWADGRIKALFIGRLDYLKGIDLIAEVSRQTGDRVCFRLVGEAVLDPSEALEWPANVEHLGWLSSEQIDAQIKACDVVLIPSRWEGFGMVAAEAMRACRPVIASAVGGLPELVEDGQTGVLIEPNSAEALKAALLTLDQGRMAEMGSKARARFEDLFTIDRVARELLYIYQQVGRQPS